MNKKNLMVSIFLLSLSYIINYAITLVLTPYITNNMGVEAYGFITLAKTVASYATIFTIALNSYSSRFIALEYHKGNLEKACKYYSSVFIGNFTIGILFLIISLSCYPLFSIIFNIPEMLINDVSFLFLLVFLNLIISTSGSALQAASYIKNKINIVGLIRTLSYFFEAITLFFLFFLFEDHLFFVGIGLIVSTIVLTLGNLIITKKYTPDLKFSLKLFSINSVKELVFNGIWNSFNSLGNQLNSGLDLVISNNMLGAISTGQISIVKTMSSVFSGIYQLISQPFQPTLLKNYSEGNVKKLVENLKLSMKLCGFISNIAFAGFVALGLSFYRLWIPTQDIQRVYLLTIIGILSCICEGAIFPLYYIYTLTLKNKIPCLVTIIGGLVNVLSMIILIKFTSMGSFAVLLTTAIIMNIINGIINPIYMAHCLKIKWYTFFSTLIRHILSLGLMTGIFKLISLIFPEGGWLLFITDVLILFVVGLIVHTLVTFTKKDYLAIKNRILVSKQRKI